MARTKEASNRDKKEKKDRIQKLAAKKRLASKKGLKKPDARVGGIIRKKRRYRPGTRALMEMRQLQKGGTKKQRRCLIPAATFRRIVEGITDEMTGALGRDKRVSSRFLQGLREETEAELRHQMEIAFKIAIHSKRKSVDKPDVELALQLSESPSTHIYNERT